jgi:hypothetical protein
VAQFLCCIPLAGIEALLTWLKPAVPQEEQDQLLAQVGRLVHPFVPPSYPLGLLWQFIPIRLPSGHYA